MVLLVLAGLALWICMLAVLLAVCRAAAEGDAAMLARRATRIRIHVGD